MTSTSNLVTKRITYHTLEDVVSNSTLTYAEGGLVLLSVRKVAKRYARPGIVTLVTWSTVVEHLPVDIVSKLPALGQEVLVSIDL